MIYSFSEQVIISIKFIVLGLYIGIMMDTAYILNVSKKILNILIQILYWIVITYVSLKSVLSISNGYIPVYTFMFFIFGYAIYYYFLKKAYIKSLNDIKNKYTKNHRKIVGIVFPREVTRFIKRLTMRVLRKINKRLKKIFIRKRKKKVEEIENDGESISDSEIDMII